MTEQKIEVRRFGHDNTQPWVVDILGNRNAVDGYVLPDGTAGPAHPSGKYKTKTKAMAAEALYLTKNAGGHNGIETSAGEKKLTCGGCKNYDLQAEDKCCIDGRGTTGQTAFVNDCQEFKPYTSTGEKTKETNPKYDAGIKKAPLHCIPCGPIYELGLAMFEGSRKYGRHNYRAMGVRASVYYDASVGHIVDWWEGEDIDPDSGVHHLIKAMACLLVVRDSMLMGNYNDDRPLKYLGGLVGRAGLQKEVADIVKKYPDCTEPYLETRKDTPRGG